MKQCKRRSIATADTCSTLTKTTGDEGFFQFNLEHLDGLFPFHILVDGEFKIVHVGEKLPKILSKPEHELHGSHIGDIVQITR